MSSKGALQQLRQEYHRKLFEKVVAEVTATKRPKKVRSRHTNSQVLEIEPGLQLELADGAAEATIQVSYYNIADGDNTNSKAIAKALIEKLGHPVSSRVPNAQQSGAWFGDITCDYLRRCFEKLSHLRPGHFEFSATQARDGILLYDQFEHLKTLSKFIREHKELRATLGGEYLIKPDIVVLKKPFSDDDLNAREVIVAEGDDVATHTSARSANTVASTLHASVSCKWTMRSDRAQNVRTEALNLIRNRKGQAPRIVFVTFEPLPSRLISAAIGTGDIDCTYHVALHELRECIAQLGIEDQLEQLDDLMFGRRIRDISDLALDLVI